MFYESGKEFKQQDRVHSVRKGYSNVKPVKGLGILRGLDFAFQSMQNDIKTDSRGTDAKDLMSLRPNSIFCKSARSNTG